MSIQAFTSDNKSSWKANLPVLWLGVFLCCASYTMCIPFLPVYLLREPLKAAVQPLLQRGDTRALRDAQRQQRRAEVERADLQRVFLHSRAPFRQNAKTPR